MSRIYNQFATVYDRMGADHHSLRMCDYTLEVFKKFRIEGKQGLEICCGTGSALKYFVDHGYAMTGIDQSPQMLAEARKKTGKSVRLVRATLPNLRITNPASGKPYRADLAISFYDSLNYLLSAKDLQTTFTQIGRHLKSGGWFIFDMNTPHALKTIWGGNVWGGALDDLAWIFRHSYDDANILATVRLTFFERHGRNWRRFDETHTERAYTLPHLRKMLKASGLRVKAIYRCYTFDRADEKTNRICVVAKRSS
jgi:SAM-dependent methyltransferase